MSINPPDYDALESEQKIFNMNSVRKDLADGNQNLIKKINTFCNNYGFDVEKIKEKIKADQTFAATFTVPPMRQSFYEKKAADYIEQLPRVRNFNILPSAGRNAYFIATNGEVVKGTNLPEKTKPSKSLDFFWITKNYKCYASHKYTRGAGGGQDNQYNDVKKFLENYQKGGVQENIILFAICDGSYYNFDSKIRDLKKLTRTNNPKSYVVNIKEIADIIDSL